MPETVSESNSELENANLEVGAKALEFLGNDIRNGDFNVRLSRDDSVETVNDGNSNYQRKLTNKFSIYPNGELNFTVNQFKFEGSVLLQYTQQKCMENCNDNE